MNDHRRCAFSKRSGTEFGLRPEQRGALRETGAPLAFFGGEVLTELTRFFGEGLDGINKIYKIETGKDWRLDLVNPFLVWRDMREGSRFTRSLSSPWQWIPGTFILIVLGAIILMPLFGSRRFIPVPAALSQAHSINLMMRAYAADHRGDYPSGKSSTEVFQELIDAGYCNDPNGFYYPMPGKTKPSTNRLMPENVSWDITSSVETGDSDLLPIVFLTGYKIEYVSSGRAVPLKEPDKIRGFAVAYKSNAAVVYKNNGLSDGIVSNVISRNFDPVGKKYQQLTPEGPLAP